MNCRAEDKKFSVKDILYIIDKMEQERSPNLVAVLGSFKAELLRKLRDMHEPAKQKMTHTFKAPSYPKTVDVVKRTCGYLGNPQARPMVHGRHQEIAARVKHMNGSTIYNPGQA